MLLSFALLFLVASTQAGPASRQDAGTDAAVATPTDAAVVDADTEVRFYYLRYELRLTFLMANKCRTNWLLFPLFSSLLKNAG